MIEKIFWDLFVIGSAFFIAIVAVLISFHSINFLLNQTGFSTHFFDLSHENRQKGTIANLLSYFLLFYFIKITANWCSVDISTVPKWYFWIWPILLGLSGQIGQAILHALIAFLGIYIFIN